MIKTTKLNLNNNNTNKLKVIDLFLTEYSRVMQIYIDYFWSYNKLDKPKSKTVKTYKFYPYNNVNVNSILSGRALKCCQTQAMTVINSSLKKQEQRYYKLKQLQNTKKDTRNLQRVIAKHKLVKPIVNDIKAELNSLNVTFLESTTSFDIVIKLSSLFSKEYKKENKLTNKWFLVVNKNKHYNKLQNKGKRLTSFLLSKNYIDVRFELPETKLKKYGSVAAIDQGITNVISGIDSLDNIIQSSNCNHGHTLTSILHKMSRCKKGSNGFKRAQEHRKNYIHWCINRLDLSNTKELRLEKIHDMRRGKKTSRFLNGFVYPLIRTKLQDRCQENGVHFVEQPSYYRSQRCNACGFVHSDSRNGKTFVCIKCNHTDDADVNAARNHLATLPPIYKRVTKEVKVSGFYWNFDGDFIVPPMKTNNIIDY